MWKGMKSNIPTLNRRGISGDYFFTARIAGRRRKSPTDTYAYEVEKLRLEEGWTVAQLTEKLSDAGFPVKTHKVKSWISGETRPAQAHKAALRRAVSRLWMQRQKRLRYGPHFLPVGWQNQRAA